MPPTPSARPSTRESRTFFLKASLASDSGEWPTPATCTQRSAGSANRSAAASAMYSGARSGLAAIRFHSGSGMRPMCSMPVCSDTAANDRER